MTGTPAFAARAWKKRWQLRGSIGVPNRVVNTNPDPIHASPAANREPGLSFIRAVLQTVCLARFNHAGVQV
jgi:hypothetical protein